MKNRIIPILVIIFLALGNFCFAVPLDLPTQKIGEREYYVYIVKKKETIYGISKSLGVQKEDIIKYNPSVAEGLKKDQKLFFPVSDFKVVDNKKNQEVIIPKSFRHLVERGETLYGLSKTYNISQDEILNANPSAQDGVKAGQILIIPQASATEDTKDDTSGMVYHSVKKGDTLYNLALKYSTSIESILSLNPGVSPTNFKIDDVIKVQPNIITLPEPKPTETPIEFFIYKIKKDETLADIAKNFGIKEQEIRQANPDVEEFKKNTKIYIPKLEHQKIVSEKEIAKKQLEKVQDIYDSLRVSNKRTLDIVLILPYMLNASKVDKQAMLYTEFYKGFLLAVDSIRKTGDRKITIRTYDTQNSDAQVEKILAKPELKNVDYIFAPEELSQLKLICEFAKKNKISVINTFVIKNDEYTSNDKFYQVNVPHSYMFAKVFEEFNGIFKDKEVVFLTQQNSNGEEKDILPELKAYFKDNENIKTHQIKFENTLQLSDLDSLLSLGGNYIFIPDEASKKFFTKITQALKKSKTEYPVADIILFGYPEWTTFTEYNADFKAIDTYIYSRFYTNTESPEYREFNRLYKKWYGSNMMTATPQFGLLGFDTGLYFMSLHNNEPIASKGIQNDFRFDRISNWGGYINKSLYFIHFSSNKGIQKISK